MGEGYASDWGEAGDKLAHAALRHTCAARYLDTEVGKFRKTLNAAILLFGTGVVAAFGFFIWNLPFTTGMGTGPANVAHAIVLKEPTMMTSALCDPLHEGWQFAPWPSKLRYFLFCLIFVLLLRVI